MRLGIDFGTTRTVVTAVEDGRYPVVSFEVGDDSTLQDWVPGIAVRPSAGAEEPLLFGWEAAGAMRRDPAWSLRSVKREISTMRPDEVVAGAGCSALELTTGYLTALRRALYEQSNLPLSPGEPLEAMVAVPAGASARQRYLTLEAFARAGFAVLGMVNEPTAAAIEYGHQHLRNLGPKSPKRYVVVYDLGGGTFDTSAVSLEHRRFELLASEGDGHIGGEDFDEIILSLALQAVGQDPDVLDATTRTELLDACREAKERVGPNSRRMLVDLGPLSADGEPVVLKTADVYEQCSPLIERAAERLEQLLDRLPEHGIDTSNPRELAAVYVVGGSSSFPPVARGLRTANPRKVAVALQPHAATSVGLAVAADPESGVFVREATTRHFGVWREAEDGSDKVFDPIVAKDQIPESGDCVVLRREYHPAHRVGHLRFLECTELTEGGEPAGDLTPLDEVLFPYDPSCGDCDLREAAAERTRDITSDEVVETYTFGTNGSISVAIENLTRGYARSYELGKH